MRDSKAAKEPILAGLANKNPFLFGIGLHAYQDSWSHHGFNALVGHKGAPFEGHAPDYPWTAPKETMDMAEATYNMLRSFAERLGTKTIAPWLVIEKKIKVLLTERLTDAADRGRFSEETKSRVDAWQDFLKKEWRLGQLRSFEKFYSKHLLQWGG